MLSGTGSQSHESIVLARGGVIVIEGLFRLQPAMLAIVEPQQRFAIYISPLVQINLDECHYVSNQTARVLRRITRDFLHRGRDAKATIARFHVFSLAWEVADGG
eukprot:TRINITY_DN8658_c0_g1_i1.p1 TRINITY_DN8658_c0_g1~~TRINITY_DN8658_c0_g1_i1.p1  ORF type:complete len:114 (+),score=21.60 TRINITY_DN8658_c0_g1_i1:33-344(+)